MQSSFNNYHPIVNFIYFVTVIIFSVMLMNPVFLVLSLTCAFVYAVHLKGFGTLKFGFGMVVPLIVLSVIINPIVNQRGATDLFELPFGLGTATLESAVYGLTTGLMIGSVIMWFVCFNVVITSDKLTFLFGRIFPGSSLIFIMILRLIPRYKEQLSKIREARQSIGMGVDTGTFGTKIRNGTRILAIMFTWALENAIQTADSMKSRGYGIKNRTSFMFYRLTFEDKVTLVLMVVLTGGIVIIWTSGVMKTDFFPFFDAAFTRSQAGELILMGMGCLFFVILALIPVSLSIKESIYWDKAEIMELKNGKQY